MVHLSDRVLNSFSALPNGTVVPVTSWLGRTRIVQCRTPSASLDHRSILGTLEPNRRAEGFALSRWTLHEERCRLSFEQMEVLRRANDDESAVCD